MTSTRHDSHGNAERRNESPDSAVASPPSALLPVLLFGFLGLLGAVIAGVAIDRIHGPDNYFQFPEEVTRKFPPMGQPIPKEVLELNEATLKELDFKNMALSLSLFGAVVCGLLGIGSGLLSKRPIPILLGLIAGLVLGPAFGCLAALAEVDVAYSLRDGDLGRMTQAIVMHATAWGVFAVAVGLSVGIPSRGVKACCRSVGMAVLAGVLAGVLYAPIAGVLFVADKSDVIAPTGFGNRIFWLALAATLMGLAAGLVWRPAPNATTHVA
jgi:hypothetical protein